MFARLAHRAAVRVVLLGLTSSLAPQAMLATAATPSLQAQGAPPRPPRPVRAPRPAAAPAPSRAPRPVDAPAPWPAPVAPALAGYLDATIDVRAIADMARAQAAVAIDHDALQAASRAMAADMVRLSTADVAAVAMQGQQFALEGQALARSLAPLAELQAQGWGATYGAARGYRTSAPEAWDAQDPADSLYRDARRALTSDSYQRAAELFRQIRQKYPKSSYASDAPYWEAFALHRLGGETNLQLAQDALGLQQRDYPRAATRGDAAALNARIEGMLGRRGNIVAAQNVRGRAERAATDGCPRAEDDERVDALNAVTQMDAERAMPILRKVLARREPCTQQLRRTAVWLVARQKSTDAAQLLMNVAKSDPDREVREQAVFWLANVPTDDAVNMLVDLARNGDDLELRKRAVYALSRAKSERAVATLRDITADSKAPEELRAEALNWYLGRTGRDVSDPLAYLKDVYAKADGTMLKQTTLRYIAGLRSDEARAYLVSLAVGDREPMELRRTAVAYLGSGGGYSNWAPRVVVQTAGRTVTVPTPVAGNATADAASRPSGAVIAASLWQVYEKAGEMEIRRQALSSLGSLRDNAGIDRLIEVARNEKQPELRRYAISALSRSKDPRALELLQEIINK